MGKQETEMLKGTLEGIVLAILSGRPAYGYEITAWLRSRASPTSPRAPCCSSVSSSAARRCGKDPVRKGTATQGVFPQRARARTTRRVLENLELPHRTGRTAPRGGDETWRTMDRAGHRIARTEEAVPAVQGPHRHPPRAVRHVAKALQRHRVLRGRHGAVPLMLRQPADLWELHEMGRRCGMSAARPCRVRRGHSPRPTPASSGSTRNAPRLERAIEDAARGEQCMTTQTAIHVQGLEKAARTCRCCGVDFEVERAPYSLCSARTAGQDHGRQGPVHAAQGRRGTASVNGFDVAAQPANVRESISLTGQFAAVDDMLTGGRNLCCRPAAAPQGPGPPIADSAPERSVDRRGHLEGRGRIRWRRPPARHRHETSSGIRRSSSWTSRRGGARPAGASRCGRRSRHSPRTAQRCCSRRGISVRPNTSGRIAILHQGRIIENGTPPSSALLPPAKVEYVEQHVRGRLPAIVGSLKAMPRWSAHPLR